MDHKERFVRFLLESGALTFGDFILKSGRKSPYMINTGKLDSGVTLSRLGCFYARTIYEKMELGVIPKDTSILFGSAYKGIPLATATAIALAAAYDIELGYAFNRKEEKDHGEGGIIVGRKPVPGDKILIIDDVMTAGTALRETVALLKKYNPDAEVVGSVLAVDRKEHGQDARLSAVAEAQYEHGFPVFSIIDIDEIVAALKIWLDCGDGQRDAGSLSKNEEDNRRADALRDYYLRNFDSDDGAALPSNEQIAAIEAYLAGKRAG